MATTDIERRQWDAFLRDFSRVNLGRRVRLWATGRTHGLLSEAVDLPLVGIDVEHVGAGAERIDVIVGDSPHAHVRHHVERPTCVRVATDDGGEAMSVQIEAEDGSSTFVDLGRPAAEATPAAFA